VNVGGTLRVASQAGLTLTTGDKDGTLKVHPAAKLTPELVAAIKGHKAAIIRIVREDEEMRRTGVIQSEREVFDLARQYYGNQDDSPGDSSARIS
jgi:hypothetical protein